MNVKDAFFISAAIFFIAVFFFKDIPTRCYLGTLGWISWSVFVLIGEIRNKKAR